MNPEAQQKAITEACGWIRAYEEGDDEGCGKWFWHKGHKNLRRPPDYLNDLNAMHEAEKVLTDEQYWQFCDHLSSMLAGNTAQIYRRAMMTAAAAQRAEAFLRTLNLWRDE